MILQISGAITTNATTDATPAAVVELFIGQVDQPQFGPGSACISVSGTWTGTISFEACMQDNAWVAINALPISGAQTAVTSTTASGVWRMNVSGLSKVRGRGSATMTGSAAVALSASSGSV